MFARIENDQVVEYPIPSLIERFPNSSLPADLTNDAGLPDGYVYVHSAKIPDFNRGTHKAVHYPPTKQDGKWIQNWQIEPFTPEELVNHRTDIEITAKNRRLKALRDSDWTQLADSPADKAAWATYRQQLRDITVQPGYPLDIVWPQPPT